MKFACRFSTNLAQRQAHMSFKNLKPSSNNIFQGIITSVPGIVPSGMLLKDLGQGCCA